MDLTSIGGAGGEYMGPGLVPVPSSIEISCTQVWSPMEWGGIKGRRSVPRGSYFGTPSGSVKVWPAVKKYLAGNSLRPLLLQYIICANLSPIYSYTLPSTICLVASATKSSCGRTASAVGFGEGGSPYRTLSEDTRLANFVGSVIGQCRLKFH